jgi:hypothetical protein
MTGYRLCVDRITNVIVAKNARVYSINVSSRTASVDDGKSKSEFIKELIKLTLVTLQHLRLNLSTILCKVRSINTSSQ